MSSIPIPIAVPVPIAMPTSAGPLDLTEVGLRPFGLGVIVRVLRTRGMPPAPLSRVYCLLCGIAIDHEPRGAGWWCCRNECNTGEWA
jgi:hypothetical protein